MVASKILNIPVYDTQCGAKIFSRKICVDIFYEHFFHHRCLMLNFFPGFYFIYGMDRTIKMSYGHPVSKWGDINGSKVKPIFFLKEPFEL